MMRWFFIALTPLLFASSGALAQAPANNTEALAQAVDRCMATYAVRLADSGQSDDDIYAEAQQGCARLNDQLTASITARYPPQQAGELMEAMNEDAQTNFMTMLAHIREGRGEGGGGK